MQPLSQNRGFLEILVSFSPRLISEQYGVIQTSFIERVNLNFRQCVAALGRQTWSLLSEQQLLHHAEWFRLYYYFARPHNSLREPIPGLKGRYRDRTPAMALGITDQVLSVGDILRTPLIPTAA